MSLRQIDETKGQKPCKTCGSYYINEDNECNICAKPCPICGSPRYANGRCSTPYRDTEGVVE